MVRSGSLMSEALIEMSAKSLGCTGVIDENGFLIGVITDGDLRRKMSADLLSMTVDEIMTKSPKTISENALAAEALALMNKHSITGLFVMEDDKPIGIIHVHDCMNAGVV